MAVIAAALPLVGEAGGCSEEVTGSAPELAASVGAVPDAAPVPTAPALVATPGKTPPGDQAQPAADVRRRLQLPCAGAAAEAQQGEPSDSAPSSAVYFSLATPRQRCASSLEHLDEAMEVAKKCAAEEETAPDSWRDNTFKQSVKLRAFLSFAAQPEFDPPPGFQQAMVTCMDCLLQSPPGHLLHGKRMVELLDSQELGPIMRYMEWLEKELREVTPAHSSSSSSRAILVPQRVRNAVCSWSSERSLLQQSGEALCEALLAHGPEHHRCYAEWHEAEERRQEIQAEEEEWCMCAARELEDSVSVLVSQLLNSSGAAWPTLARASEASLRGLQHLATNLLRSRKESWACNLEEYESMGIRSNTCKRIVLEERQHIRRCELEFKQAAQRFSETANQFLAWIRDLLPKLRDLEASCMDLTVAVQLHEHLPELEGEYMAAEDELDEAETELRKQRRHSRASRGVVRAGKATASEAAAEAATRQCELRVAHASERVQAVSNQLQEAERRLQEAEASLPLALDPEEFGALSSPCSPRCGGRGGEQGLTSEERLAKKLAALDQMQEDAAVQVSEAHAEHHSALQQASDQRIDQLLWKQVEPDFMCPILHERMREPVLAADGHTYERGAIEKWLQQHSTSPMTGAPLAHRYLTENFALRRLIAAHNVGAPRGPSDDGQLESAEERSSSAPSCTQRRKQGGADEEEEEEGFEEADLSEDQEDDSPLETPRQGWEPGGEGV